MKARDDANILILTTRIHIQEIKNNFVESGITQCMYILHDAFVSYFFWHYRKQLDSPMRYCEAKNYFIFLERDRRWQYTRNFIFIAQRQDTYNVGVALSWFSNKRVPQMLLALRHFGRRLKSFLLFRTVKKVETRVGRSH